MELLYGFKAGEVGIKCNIDKVSSIIFNINSNIATPKIIVIYDYLNKRICSTLEDNLQIKVANSKLFIDKLNKYGFRTVSCDSRQNAFDYNSFAVII